MEREKAEFEAKLAAQHKEQQEAKRNEARLKTTPQLRNIN